MPFSEIYRELQAEGRVRVGPRPHPNYEHILRNSRGREGYVLDHNPSLTLITIKAMMDLDDSLGDRDDAIHFLPQEDAMALLDNFVRQAFNAAGEKKKSVPMPNEADIQAFVERLGALVLTAVRDRQRIAALVREHRLDTLEPEAVSVILNHIEQGEFPKKLILFLITRAVRLTCVKMLGEVLPPDPLPYDEDELVDVVDPDPLDSVDLYEPLD